MMKIRCINNIDFSECLTIGKEYYDERENVLTKNDDCYYILDDFGNYLYYDKRRFEIVEEKKQSESSKEQELKFLQKYLISELNKISDQLERIQAK